MNAIILAAGDAETRGSYFNPAAQYLIDELAAMGIAAQRGAVLTGEPTAYLDGVGKAYKEHALIFLLTAPQPRTAATVAAVMAKGMKLELVTNPAAKEQVLENAQQDGGPYDPKVLASFFLMPTGAVVFENPLGPVQGYAVVNKSHLLVALPAQPGELAQCLNSQLPRLLAEFQNALPAQPTTRPPAHKATGIAGIMARMGGHRKRQPPTQTERETHTMPRTNLLGRMRTGRLTKNDKIRLGAVVLFLSIFVGCMVYISSVFKESSDNKALSGDLKDLFTSGGVAPEKVKGGYPKNYLPKFAGLYEQNRDVAGWIKIPDTQLDYVVVQTTDNLFYDRKDFTTKTNQHGVPFVDYRVDLAKPSTNTVIYSHNMDDGQMFGELTNYKKLAYYQQHPIVEYDSVYHEGKYKIFGIVLCKTEDPDFNYHNFIEKKDDKAMTEYVNKIRERSLINTKVDLRTDDTLLTLSTCDYSFKSSTGEHISRFVIFARKVRKDESLTVDVAGATVNQKPVMPTEWYDELARQRKKHEQEAAAQAASQSAAQAATVNSRWITDYEAADMTPEEQQRLVERRKADAKKYLTTDEQTSGLDEMLSLIEERQYNFELFLSSEEQKQSINTRIHLAEEHRALANEWLTPEEIRSAGRWSRIQALITERQSGKLPPTTTDKWLTAEENKTLSAAEKSALKSKRQAAAQAAGVTKAELDAATTWEEIEGLIASKTSGGAAEKYIKENPKWLDDRDLGLTKAELQSLVTTRKDMAKAAGLTAAEISQTGRWAEMEALINSKSTVAAAEKLIRENPQWLDSRDKGQSKAALEALITKRMNDAAAANIDPTKYRTWAEMEKAIKAGGKPIGPGVSDKVAT